MSDRSAIEWTDASWNPVSGCSKVSPGCAHCYAEALTLRFRPASKPWWPAFAAENVVLHPERLGAPLRWRRPRRVFVNSMSDLFHEQVPDAFIDRVFAVMALAQGQTFQVLTKRPERMRAYFARPDAEEWVADHIYAAPMRESAQWVAAGRGRVSPAWPLPNVWLGVSVENERWAEARVPVLVETPAAVRFLSCEPLLGPLDLNRWLGRLPVDWRTNPDPVEPPIDWVIVGGESGPRARPMDLAWVRAIRDQCRRAGVPLFIKQLGGLRPGTALCDLPSDLRIREYPK